MSKKTKPEALVVSTLVAKVAEGKVTPAAAAAAMSLNVIERLKPRARQPFVAWGKRGFERYNRVLFTSTSDKE